ncbi:MAG: NACHT domain-containing protein, partial [Pseudomonadota bacterium]
LRAAAAPASPGPEAAAGLAARIARAAGLTWGRVRFVGLPDKSPKPQTTVSDLFVPLALEVGEKETPQTCEQIEAALLAPGAGPAARYAVLGDPGSGKTTLVRWLCARASARAEAGEPFRAPLVVVLREYVRQGRRDGLLAFAAHEIRTQLSIPLDEPALAALCHAGQALLLVDGLDEVAVPTDRERVSDMLASLAREHPALPVLGTSRIVGYDAAPLPRSEFRHRRLLPFTDAQLTEFVRRWYAAALPDDARLRERRQAELSAALETEPSARELARNPLFATLIALVHHFEARLPGERARLYELCVQMLLETWPRAAGREFRQLDPGRQRDVLQRLALRMQEGRKGGGQSVAIARDELERVLYDLLRARFAAGACDAEVQSLARAWVAWMAAGTGVLVEQQPGAFAFLHLSVMEYLAGRALLEHEGAGGDGQVAAFVAEHHREQHWRETLLLMLGSEATRRGLVDAVVARLLPAGEPMAWETATFGLALLREEVDLSPAQREAVLAGAAGAAVEVEPGSWREARKLLGDVLRFGKRHPEAARAWLEGRLGRAEGDDLLGTAALCGDLLDPETILAGRADAARAVLPLLDLGPGEPWGRQAWARADRATWLAWAGGAATEVLPWWACAALVPGRKEAAAALCAGLLRRSAAIGGAQAHAAEALAQVKRPGGRGVPAAMAWEGATGVRVELAPALTGGGDPGAAMAFARDFANDFASDFASSFASSFARYFARYFASSFARYFASSFASSFARYFASSFARYFASSFARYFASSFARYFARYFASSFARYFASDFASDFARYFASDFASDFALRGQPKGLAAPPAQPPPSPWEALNQARSEREAFDTAAPFLTALVADAHASLLCAPAWPDDPTQAALLASHRMQNRWLHLFLEPIAAHLGPAAEIPEFHALLLALGLAQYQTTWQWPWGDHWARWFADGAAPPEHWLPAFFWHACQAVGCPAEPDHLAAAQSCLERADWPELAAELRRYQPRPTPPEILALFGNDDPA